MAESYRETERELVDEENIVESVFTLHFRWVVCLLVFCLFRGRGRGDLFGKGLENCLRCQKETNVIGLFFLFVL